MSEAIKKKIGRPAGAAGSSCVCVKFGDLKQYFSDGSPISVGRKWLASTGLKLKLVEVESKTIEVSETQQRKEDKVAVTVTEFPAEPAA